MLFLGSSTASSTSQPRSFVDGTLPSSTRTHSSSPPFQPSEPSSHSTVVWVPTGNYIPVFNVVQHHPHDHFSRHHFRFPHSQASFYPWAPAAEGVSNACPQCRSWPSSPNHRFCSIGCYENAATFAPKLLKLAPSHVKYLEIVHRFMRRWRGVNRPSIRDIFMITWTEQYQRDYERYRDAVESQGRFTRRGLSSGNEQKQFRGTARACTLGEKGNVTPCYNAACQVCVTIRYGFERHLQHKRKHSRQSYSGVRLGAGIYCTHTSSKADQYAKNINNPRSSSVKAMFMCRVVVGTPLVTNREDPTLISPPAGYDSVCGKPGSGSRFVDDECVVYDSNAVRAAYLILYDVDA